MERRAEHDLALLNSGLVCMAERVCVAVQQAVESLVQRDLETAENVLRQDHRINSLDIEIDEQCLRMLALYQPEACDLRFVATAMAINNNLERIADQAVNIAERSIELLKEPPLKPLVDIPHLSRLSQEMLKQSVDSFVRQDADLARAVCVRDDQVDALNEQVFRELLTYMLESPQAITRAVNLILVGRHLERVADHATNIAEAVIYRVEGKYTKHRIGQLESV